MGHVNYRKRPELKKSPVVKAMPRICSDDLAAVEFLEQTRWGDTPCCPRCGDTDVIKLADKKTGERNARFLWKCHGCKRQFTVRIGTVYEESRIPLRHWCFAFWAMSASKKGVSAMQIMRQTGVSYKSALFLLHRIRFAMAPAPGTAEKLTGTVECDETYVGGKPRRGSGVVRKDGRGTSKVPVVALVQRDGGVRAAVVQKIDTATLKEHCLRHADQSARLITDDFPAYRRVGHAFDGGHLTVNHGSGEYSNGDACTNTVEGFFSLLKRGIYGTFHAVSRTHLHRYVSEFEFRYNARKLNDGERTLAAIRAADGKRLMYREPSGEAA